MSDRHDPPRELLNLSTALRISNAATVLRHLPTGTGSVLRERDLPWVSAAIHLAHDILALEDEQTIRDDYQQLVDSGAPHRYITRLTSALEEA